MDEMDGITVTDVQSRFDLEDQLKAAIARAALSAKVEAAARRVDKVLSAPADKDNSYSLLLELHVAGDVLHSAIAELDKEVS